MPQNTGKWASNCCLEFFFYISASKPPVKTDHPPCHHPRKENEGVLGMWDDALWPSRPIPATLGLVNKWLVQLIVKTPAWRRSCLFSKKPRSSAESHHLSHSLPRKMGWERGKRACHRWWMSARRLTSAGCCYSRSWRGTNARSGACTKVNCMFH